MRLNDAVKVALLAGVLATPALAQQATPDPAVPSMPGRAVPERAAPATPAPSVPREAMPQERRVDPAETVAGMRASKLVGKAVRNAENQAIGTVDDLIISDDKRVPIAVLSVGGFLGIGAKLVKVPFDDLTIDAEGNVMLPGATRESLRALPEVKYPG